MQLPIPWAEDSWDGDFGNGVLATYSGVESWTFLVGAYFNTNLGGRINEYEIYNSPLSEYPQGSSSIYTAAALGSISIVDAQLWLGRVESNIDYMALLQLSTDHAGFDATVQVQQTKLKGETQTALNLSEDKGIFWAAKAGYTFAGLRVGAGYISNDKDQPVYTLRDRKSVV